MTLRTNKNKIHCFSTDGEFNVFLYSRSKILTQIILHVRGAINEEGNPGFVDGESVFLAKHTSSTKIEVIKQVGVVNIRDGQLFFNYTDDDFKKLINYKEDTGYSIMDGAD